MKKKSILALALMTLMSTSIFMIGCSGSNNGATGNRANNATSKINQGINEVGQEFHFDTATFVDNIKGSGYDITNYSVEENLPGSAVATSYSLGNDKVYVYQYNTRNDLHQDIMTLAELKKNGINDEFSNVSHYYKQGKLLIRYEGTNSENLSHFDKSFGNLFI
ncbi:MULTISPECIES: hypothetical protein [Clostridium]|uniref:Lipoprotein n=1 Tax=Clostridium botulinum (strain Eklund 17B / Type B) TaxID=935198 RepID=B2TIB2_CLOBB|nr:MULTISPECIES: hypothetical protein [Clostridium]ACD23231.1 putative lipoprotein [Clostridium botulinum B str. Eklund 17B (NRP)]MBN1045482.1 hypothetical protein [Clostridium botulinum]MBN1052161.1 hypothetical protein [Clostridium botulinum]MBN1055356.1 hypothetical protein [Clostridium botulinum]MBY6977227.1 hypothetical protein [Clostridium botulinum]